MNNCANVSGQGVTPLMSAVKHKNLHMVQTLINAKSDVNLHSQTDVRADTFACSRHVYVFTACLCIL